MPKAITISKSSGTETSLTMSQQIIGGGGNVLGPTVNGYFPLNGGADATTTIDLFSANMPIGGQIKKLIFDCDLPPGTGETVECTLYKNGAATSLVATIAGNVSTFDFNDTNVITFTANDHLAIMVVNSLLSATTRVNWGAVIIIP